jgi:hypothetical protein
MKYLYVYLFTVLSIVSAVWDNKMTIMINDLEEMWDGAVVVQFQVLPGDLPGVTEKTT